MEKILVRDIMTRDPVVVGPNESLFSCAKKMVRKRFNALIIADKKRLVGFISQKDILWALVKKPNVDLSKIKAIDISPKKVATIKPTTTIQEAIRKMNKMKFDRLPVTNGDEVVGIVTTRDVLSFHPELYPELAEFARVRDEQEKLKRISQLKESDFSEGVCESCGVRDTLTKFNGMMICESCKNSI